MDVRGASLGLNCLVLGTKCNKSEKTTQREGRFGLIAKEIPVHPFHVTYGSYGILSTFFGTRSGH